MTIFKKLFSFNKEEKEVEYGDARTTPDSHDARVDLCKLQIPQNPTIIIGIGNGRCNFMKKLAAVQDLDSYVPNPYLMMMYFGTSLYDDTETDRTWADCLLKADSSERYEISYYDKVFQKNKLTLTQLTDAHPQQAIIVTGLGGTSGFKACSLIKFLLKHKVPVKAIVTMPYKFEGYKSSEFARVTLLSLSRLTSDVTVLCNEDVLKHNPDITKSDVFSEIDKKLLDIVLNKCEAKRLQEVLNEIYAQPAANYDEYGQIQTICDIIKVLNTKKRYTSIEDLIADLNSAMKQYAKRGTVSEKSLNLIRSGVLENIDLFKDGKLDIELFRSRLLSVIKEDDDKDLEKVMTTREVYKLLSIVSYFNDFRRYTDIKKVQADLYALYTGAAQSDEYKYDFNDRMFHNIPIGGHAYPFIAFVWALSDLWSEVTTDGILDNKKLQAKMIDEYQKDRREKELDEIAAEHYVDDGPCHPEVFFPKKGEYYGPVLVNLERWGNPGNDRRYVESCGEGKGPNSSPDFYEFRLAESFIREDPKYTVIENDKPWGDIYFVPSEDYTLPVYYWMGGIRFDSQKEKEEFIEKVKNGQL